jgi:hypothetical protein
MELSTEERDLIIKSLLTTASSDIIYVHTSGSEDVFESNDAINLALKLRGNSAIKTVYTDEFDDIRAIVREDGEGLFEKNTAQLLKCFPEIKTDIFVK